MMTKESSPEAGCAEKESRGNRADLSGSESSAIELREGERLDDLQIGGYYVIQNRDKWKTTSSVKKSRSALPSRI